MVITAERSPIEYPDAIPLDSFWNDEQVRDSRMHSIHYYPAKFPSFIVSKSIEYAKKRKINISTIADIFCGCGTTALEARLHNVNFWGCDINPVATLIAKVKSQCYDESRLTLYFNTIIQNNRTNKKTAPAYFLAHPRLNYWFSKRKIIGLYRLLSTINKSVPAGKYRDFFLCAFSNILKPSSRWLTKSIKPQIDPTKRCVRITKSFSKQFDFMIKAIRELKNTSGTKTRIKIITANYLGIKIRKPIADIVITSPPYVTSYEYADLHQLSSIWLGFSKDYRTLREGSIGSLYHEKITEEKINRLNGYAIETYHKLLLKDSGQARSIIKYFYDMKKTIGKTHRILKPGGLAVFVIGNTEYCGVPVNNAKYLYDCMAEQGFDNVKISKRIIRRKTLSPYRNSKGRFSSNPNDRKVYRYEFVITAEKIK